MMNSGRERSRNTTSSAPAMLSGLRVLDLSWQLPGPYAAKLLADLGAQVISVEPPGGDPTRAYATLFYNMNVGKRCMIADLKDDSDREYVLELAQTADVLLEGFRPGVADRLGIGYATVSEKNPRIIYCSVSGYGQSGEWALEPGHDLNYLGLAGVLGVGTQAVGMPYLPIGDLAAGLMSAFSIMAACMARGEAGTGEYIDVSMADTIASWMASRAGAAIMGDVDLIGDSPHYGLFEAADGELVALGVVFEDHFWKRLCKVFDLQDLADLSFEERVARGDLIRDALRRKFRERGRDELVQQLRQAGVPVSPANTAADAFRLFGGKWINGLPIYAHPVRYKVHQLVEQPTELEPVRRAWL